MTETDYRRTEKLTKEAKGFLRTFYDKTRAMVEYRLSVRRYTVGLQSHADYCNMQRPVSKCIFTNLFSQKTSVAPRFSCADPPAPPAHYHWLTTWVYGQPETPKVDHCVVYERDKQRLDIVASWLDEAEKQAKEAEAELQKRVVVLTIPDKKAKIFALAEVADIMQNKSYTYGKIEYSVPTSEELYEFGSVQILSNENWRVTNLWSEYDIVDEFFSP